MEKVQTFVIGLVAGVALAALIGFKSGLVVTKTTMEEAVKSGEVLKLATICASEAKEDLTAQHKDPKAFKGWDNYSKRDEFVKSVVSDLHIPKDLMIDVSTKCSDLLS